MHLDPARKALHGHEEDLPLLRLADLVEGRPQTLEMTLSLLVLLEAGAGEEVVDGGDGVDFNTRPCVY